MYVTLHGCAQYIVRVVPLYPFCFHNHETDTFLSGKPI